jgi:hypothetical protein
MAQVEPEAKAGGHGQGSKEEQGEMGWCHCWAGAVRKCRASGNGIGKLWHKIKWLIRGCPGSSVICK